MRSTVASLDQALLSALNFLVSIILIKTVSKNEYGYFAIALAISYFLISIQNAIVTTPLTVLLVAKKGDFKLNYARALCWGQFFVLIPAVCIGLFVIALLYATGMAPIKASIAGTVCLASTGILLREFLRAYYFARETTIEVLKLDLCYFALYLSLIAITVYYFTISIDKIFLYIGLSAVLASIIADRRLSANSKLSLGSTSILSPRRISLSFDPGIIKQSYSENWRFGKWALLGVITSHIQNHGHLYLLGGFMGSAAVADMSASRLLFAPFVMIQAGWGKVTIPHGARLRESQNLKRYLKELLIISLSLGVVIFLYVYLILNFSSYLEGFLFSKQYKDVFDYAILWGVVFTLGWIRMNASYGLQVIKQFKPLAKVNIFTMIVTLGSAFFLIKGIGIKGALTALCLGEVIFAGILWWLLVSHIFSMRSAE